MRIGIDATGAAGWRGPSRNIRNLIKYLSAVSGNHELYLYSNADLKDHVQAGGTAVHVILPHQRGVSWYNVTLPLKVIRDKIDVFLFPQANFWLWKPVKTVIVFRSSTISPWENNVIETLSAQLKRSRVRHIADAICAVSHFNAAQLGLTCGVEHQKVNIINNGIDPAFNDKNIMIAKHYKNYFIFVGGNEILKNFNNMILAFKILVNRGYDYKLVVVGGKYGNEPEDMVKRELVDSLDIGQHVIFHGVEKDVKKLASLYKGAKAVIYPSFQETFGMIAVEAMACGCPVIASFMPAIPEICGNAALYFDPYDPGDMAEKIEMVLINEKLRQDLIGRGYERIKKYSWEGSAQKLLTVIEQAAKS